MKTRFRNVRRRLDINSSTQSTSNSYADDSTLHSNSSFGENFEMEDEYDFHDPNVTELDKYSRGAAKHGNRVEAEMIAFMINKSKTPYFACNKKFPQNGSPHKVSRQTLDRCLRHFKFL